MRRAKTVAVRLARSQTWSQMPLRFLRLKSSKRSYTAVGEALRRHAGSIPLTRKCHFVRLIRAPPPGETSGSPVVDPAGKLLGYRGADTDVTERKAAGQLIHRRQRSKSRTALLRGGR